MAVPTNWKDNNRHLQILRNAEKGRYGVIAAIAYNLEQIYGLVAAAEQAQSPLILQFFPWAVTYADGLLVRTAKESISRASVPISIHLDHAQDEKIIKHAADNLPFDSIMVDMSHYEKDENLEKTATWVKYCHERGIATEAEPGRIEGAEDGVMDTAGLEASKTTPEEVDQFIATGVDALAPAFGNVHGEYGKQGPQLDFERYAAALFILCTPLIENQVRQHTKTDWRESTGCSSRHKWIPIGSYAAMHRCRGDQNQREQVGSR